MSYRLKVSQRQKHLAPTKVTAWLQLDAHTINTMSTAVDLCCHSLVINLSLSILLKMAPIPVSPSSQTFLQPRSPQRFKPASKLCLFSRGGILLHF